MRWESMCEECVVGALENQYVNKSWSMMWKRTQTLLLVEPGAPNDSATTSHPAET